MASGCRIKVLNSGILFQWLRQTTFHCIEPESETMLTAQNIVDRDTGRDGTGGLPSSNNTNEYYYDYTPTGL